MPDASDDRGETWPDPDWYEICQHCGVKVEIADLYVQWFAGRRLWGITHGGICAKEMRDRFAERPIEFTDSKGEPWDPG